MFIYTFESVHERTEGHSQGDLTVIEIGPDNHGNSRCQWVDVHSSLYVQVILGYLALQRQSRHSCSHDCCRSRGLRLRKSAPPPPLDSVVECSGRELKR